MSNPLSPFGPVEQDSIIIRSLSAISRIQNTETPGKNELQPTVVHLRVIPSDGFSSSIKHDQLDQDTISYFDLSEEISGCLHPDPSNSFVSVHDLISKLQISILRDIETQQQGFNPPNSVGPDSHGTPPAPPTRFDYLLSLEFPSIISLATLLTISRSSAVPNLTRIHIHQIKIHAIIGILPHERTKKQSVIVSLVLWNINTLPLDIQALTQSVYDTVSHTIFQTVEALANAIAAHVLAFHNNQISRSIKRVTVTVEKPQAVSYASGVGVEVTRSL